MKVALRVFVVVLAVLACAVLAFLWIGNGRFGSKLANMPARTGEGGVMLSVVSGCSQALPWSEPSKVVTIERAASRLTAVVQANAVCGDLYPVKPVVRRDDREFVLGWSWWSPAKPEFAACFCTRHIEFTIPNIEGSTPSVAIALENLQLRRGP